MNLSSLTNKVDFLSEDSENKKQHIELYLEAERYLTNHPWCDEILDSWCFNSWSDKFMVLLFKITPNQGADEYVWIIVGDIPSAYIDIETAPNGGCAIKAYINVMYEWIHAVENKEDINEVFPLNVPPKPEYAKMLGSRLNYIKENILIHFTKDLSFCSEP